MNKCTQFILLALLPSLAAAQQDTSKRNSLYTSLSEAKTDAALMQAYTDLGSYYRLEDRDSATAYFNKALPIAARQNLKFDEANLLNGLGVILMQQEKFSQSLELYLKAVNIAKDPAIEKTIWQLPPGQTRRNARLQLLSESYDLIGILNAYTGNWKLNTRNQMKNYREAEKYALEAGDSTTIAYIKFHMGIAYMSDGKMDSAFLFLNNAISTFTALKDPSGLGRASKYLGDAYQRKGEFNVAAQTILKALPLLQETNDQVHIALAYISLNRIYTDLTKNDSALYYAREALKIFEKRKDPFGKRDAFNMLYSHFDRVGQTDSAIAYLKLAKSLSDSLGEEERKNLLSFQDVVVEEQAKLEKLEKEKIENREKLRIYALIAGILVAIVIVFLLYRNNRQRKRTAETLLKRNEEIENTLSQLRATQAQLIQSEKMASLGELTAGIAHEIQNPLNFVNNFSDVNQELIDDLQEELRKGDTHEASKLAENLKENEAKINLHGKRADSIVKSMLQHSRSSTGQKELTDVNKLVDEYLRLAFHGYRAKTKDFNADLQIDLDPLAGSVMLVKQDIGRVILNLLNNAFYAVYDKTKRSDESFKPVIGIRTSRTANGVTINIEDNGPGIPSAQKEKIFQPFFTTKPTGIGTGLGLSLSYDIIKAHGGEIAVTSTEGQGTAFTIILPV